MRQRTAIPPKAADIVGLYLNTAMHGFEAERLENDYIERALDQIGIRFID